MKRFELEARRLFLKALLFSGTVTVLDAGWMLRHTIAMGTFKYPTGVQKLKGKVSINGKPAQASAGVSSADVITVRIGMKVTQHEVLQVPQRPVPKAERDKYVRLISTEKVDFDI